MAIPLREQTIWKQQRRAQRWHELTQELMQLAPFMPPELVTHSARQLDPTFPIQPATHHTEPETAIILHRKRTRRQKAP